MRKLTMALLGGASICLSFTIALLIWRAGGGVAAAAAGLAGGMALALTLQVMVGRLSDQKAISREVQAMRDAHLAMADQLEHIHEKLAVLTDAIDVRAVRRSEELTTEVRMLESLVQRMSESLEERLAAAPALVSGSASAAAVLARHEDHTQALLATVREALADNRVDLYLQPVVSLPQRRTVFYEGFSRLRDDSGRVLMPAEYLRVAEPDGLITAIDNLLLFRCVQIVRRLAKQDRKVGIFCNISFTSLGDESFFPQFLEFLSENRDMAGGLIFELGQAAFEARGPVESRNMAKLADMGFRFSVDKISTLDIDFRELQRSDVKFAKISASVLLEQLLEMEGRQHLKSLKDIQSADYAALARRYGVELIAEKVETERQVIDVLELDIGYGQGHLFGEPRAIKDAVLAETDPPADYLRSTLRRKSARAG